LKIYHRVVSEEEAAHAARNRPEGLRAAVE